MASSERTGSTGNGRPSRARTDEETSTISQTRSNRASQANRERSCCGEIRPRLTATERVRRVSANVSADAIRSPSPRIDCSAVASPSRPAATSALVSMYRKLTPPANLGSMAAWPTCRREASPEWLSLPQAREVPAVHRPRTDRPPQGLAESRLRRRVARIGSASPYFASSLCRSLAAPARPPLDRVPSPRFACHPRPGGRSGSSCSSARECRLVPRRYCSHMWPQ